MPYRYEVKESHGALLTLYVWDGNGTLVYGNSSWTRAPGSLRDRLKALEAGENPAAWEGNELLSEELVRDARRVFLGCGLWDEAQEEEIFDQEGALIPLSEAEYYEDQPSARLICASGYGPVPPEEMGQAGLREFYPD